MNTVLKECRKCGRHYTVTHDCLAEKYDEGYQAGKKAALGRNAQTCLECGEVYEGFLHKCNEYEKGYRAGKRAAEEELGYPGNGFIVEGE